MEQSVTVSRKLSEWSGYKRQPKRTCFYVGFTIYIPKVERRDLSIYNGKNIELSDKRPISENIRSQVSKILASKYDDIGFQKVSHNNRETELGIVTKNGYSYSENNMGFGEGRLLYMIDLLECSPEQSLFVLEEPETSLHESAQYHFAKYLLDVCARRNHQIILTTHSGIILEALPAESRKYILRDKNQTNVIDRVSAYRAKSLLSDGFEKSLIICVEDDFASMLLTEVIRSSNPKLLKNVKIQPIGDTKAVLNTVKLLRNMKIRAIGVRDADKGPSDIDKVFSLPGSNPPEKEVYLDRGVQGEISNKYGIDIPQILSANINLDHHSFGEVFSEHACETKEVLNNYAIQIYIKQKGLRYFEKIINEINENV